MEREGEAIEGSRFVRGFCASCKEPVRKHAGAYVVCTNCRVNVSGYSGHANQISESEGDDGFGSYYSHVSTERDQG